MSICCINATQCMAEGRASTPKNRRGDSEMNSRQACLERLRPLMYPNLGKFGMDVQFFAVIKIRRLAIDRRRCKWRLHGATAGLIQPKVG